MADEMLSVEELERMNEEVRRYAESQAQGARVVLLVGGGRYAEVVRKEGDAITLAFHNRLTTLTVAQAAGAGLARPVPATRITKANGTLMYFAENADGTDWYVAGEIRPAVKARKTR